MRKWIVLFLCIGLSACSQQASSSELHDLNGNVVSLNDAKGKWVLINYWADWCGPCRMEIPALNAFARAHPKEVLVLGVNYDHLPLKVLRNAVADLNIHYIVLQEDPAIRLGIQDISVVPVTYLINPQGKLLAPLVGPQTYEQLSEIIR